MPKHRDYQPSQFHLAQNGFNTCRDLATIYKVQIVDVLAGTSKVSQQYVSMSTTHFKGKHEERGSNCKS